MEHHFRRLPAEAPLALQATEDEDVVVVREQQQSTRTGVPMDAVLGVLDTLRTPHRFREAGGNAASTPHSVSSAAAKAAAVGPRKDYLACVEQHEEQKRRDRVANARKGKNSRPLQQRKLAVSFAQRHSGRRRIVGTGAAMEAADQHNSSSSPEGSKSRIQKSLWQLRKGRHEYRQQSMLLQEELHLQQEEGRLRRLQQSLERQGLLSPGCGSGSHGSVPGPATEDSPPNPSSPQQSRRLQEEEEELLTSVQPSAPQESARLLRQQKAQQMRSMLQEQVGDSVLTLLVPAPPVEDQSPNLPSKASMARRRLLGLHTTPGQHNSRTSTPSPSMTAKQLLERQGSHKFVVSSPPRSVLSPRQWATQRVPVPETLCRRVAKVSLQERQRAVSAGRATSPSRDRLSPEIEELLEKQDVEVELWQSGGELKRMVNAHQRMAEYPDDKRDRLALKRWDRKLATKLVKKGQHQDDLAHWFQDTLNSPTSDLDREVAVIEEDLYQKYAASCNPSNFLILPGSPLYKWRHPPPPKKQEKVFLARKLSSGLREERERSRSMMGSSMVAEENMPTSTNLSPEREQC